MANRHLILFEDSPSKAPPHPPSCSPPQKPRLRGYKSPFTIERVWRTNRLYPKTRQEAPPTTPPAHLSQSSRWGPGTEGNLPFSSLGLDVRGRGDLRDPWLTLHHSPTYNLPAKYSLTSALVPRALSRTVAHHTAIHVSSVLVLNCPIATLQQQTMNSNHHSADHVSPPSGPSIGTDVFPPTTTRHGLVQDFGPVG